MLWIQFIIQIILSIVLLGLLIQFFNMLFRGHAPMTATSKGVIKKLVQTIKLKNNQIFYDLGCGEGYLLHELSVAYPKANLIGIEYAILPWLLAKIQQFINGNRIKIKKKNFFKIDLSQADYIYCYLNSEITKELYKKFRKECKINVTIISNIFQIPDAKLEKSIKIDKNNILYFYKLK